MVIRIFETVARFDCSTTIEKALISRADGESMRVNNGMRLRTFNWDTIDAGLIQMLEASEDKNVRVDFSILLELSGQTLDPKFVMMLAVGSMGNLKKMGITDFKDLDINTEISKVDCSKTAIVMIFKREKGGPSPLKGKIGELGRMGIRDVVEMRAGFISILTPVTGSLDSYYGFRVRNGES